MLQLVLAILCSVTVGVLIKYARMKGIHIAQSYCSQLYYYNNPHLFLT